MPYSSGLFDDVFKKFISIVKPTSVLDIGVGAGKYGKLIRENITSHLIGVEIEQNYISKFNLNQIYDEIWITDANNIINDHIDSKWDLIILGDVIEHMRKSQGIDLLNFLLYRSKHIIIVFPDRFLQNTIDDNKYEAHISAWNRYDFIGFQHIYKESDIMRFVLINGYLSDVNNFNNFSI